MSLQLIVGAGSSAAPALAEIMRRVRPGGTDLPGVDPPVMVQIASHFTEEESWEKLTISASRSLLDAAWRDPERFNAGWINREALRLQPGEAVDPGGRALARFLLLLDQNRTQIAEYARRIAAGGVREVTVWLLASAADAEGGGLLVDLAELLASDFRAAGATCRTHAVLWLPPAGEDADAARALALLREINWAVDPAVRGRGGSFPPPAFDRIWLLPAENASGEAWPLDERLETLGMLLLTHACLVPWSASAPDEPAAITGVDPAGNASCFTGLELEWLHYPRAEIVSGIALSQIRRGLRRWLVGGGQQSTSDLAIDLPFEDSERLAQELLGHDRERVERESMEPLRLRRPWLHRGDHKQWLAVDGEVLAATASSLGVVGRGMPAFSETALRKADRLLNSRLDRLHSLVLEWLRRGDRAVEGTARLLDEVAADLDSAADPTPGWEEQWRTTAKGKARLLQAVADLQRDPFAAPWRRLLLRRLLDEFAAVLRAHQRALLRAAFGPAVTAVRQRLRFHLSLWSRQLRILGRLSAEVAAGAAREETLLLKWLHQQRDSGHLLLGELDIPAVETPHLGEAGWEPSAAMAPLLEPLPAGLRERTAGTSLETYVLSGPAPDPGAQTAQPGRLEPSTVESAGEQQARENLARASVWLTEVIAPHLKMTALDLLFLDRGSPLKPEQRLAELVGARSDLPGLLPPEAREDCSGSLIQTLLSPAAEGAGSAMLQQLLADRSPAAPRPVRHTDPSGSYIISLLEHTGFGLQNCSSYLALDDRLAAAHPDLLRNAWIRSDLPWQSMGPLRGGGLHDAEAVFYLALALGVLTPGVAEIAVPPALLPPDSALRRPLPRDTVAAVRQLAGDLQLLSAIRQAVDRRAEARGEEWTALQLAPGSATPAAEFEWPGGGRAAALRAADLMPALLPHLARSPAFLDPGWLGSGGAGYVCPACGRDLGVRESSLPARCPGCAQLLLPHRLEGMSDAAKFARIPNPFVVGTPLEARSSLFVGREDIIRQIRERLVRPASRTILILLGERRCGKTSALKQLEYRLEGDLAPVYVDMQGLTATDLPTFIWWLVWRIRESLLQHGMQFDLPDYEEFLKQPADYQFESRLLPAIRRAVNGRRLLLMLDEFEVLAGRVANGSFDSRAFDYVRHLMQHCDGIEFLFAGTHVLRQFAASYATFLFNIGVFLNVDFLHESEAVRLIREPLEPAGVTWSSAALASVLELAGAHAYFTQMFGFHLVERLNRLEKRRVDQDDVEAEAEPVIDAAGAHLDHLWSLLSPGDRLMLALFVRETLRGASISSSRLTAVAQQEDPDLRPFQAAAAVEKLLAVGLLRRPAGAPGAEPEYALSAEVYRYWIRGPRSYGALREAGVSWRAG